MRVRFEKKIFLQRPLAPNGCNERVPWMVSGRQDRPTFNWNLRDDQCEKRGGPTSTPKLVNRPAAKAEVSILVRFKKSLADGPVCARESRPFVLERNSSRIQSKSFWLCSSNGMPEFRHDRENIDSVPTMAREMRGTAVRRRNCGAKRNRDRFKITFHSVEWLRYRRISAAAARRAATNDAKLLDRQEPFE